MTPPLILLFANAITGPDEFVGLTPDEVERIKQVIGADTEARVNYWVFHKENNWVTAKRVAWDDVFSGTLDQVLDDVQEHTRLG